MSTPNSHRIVAVTGAVGVVLLALGWPGFVAGVGAGLILHALIRLAQIRFRSERTTP